MPLTIPHHAPCTFPLPTHTLHSYLHTTHCHFTPHLPLLPLPHTCVHLHTHAPSHRHYTVPAYHHPPTNTSWPGWPCHQLALSILTDLWWGGCSAYFISYTQATGHLAPFLMTFHGDRLFDLLPLHTLKGKTCLVVGLYRYRNMRAVAFTTQPLWAHLLSDMPSVFCCYSRFSHLPLGQADLLNMLGRLCCHHPTFAHPWDILCAFNLPKGRAQNLLLSCLRVLNYHLQPRALHVVSANCRLLLAGVAVRRIRPVGNGRRTTITIHAGIGLVVTVPAPSGWKAATGMVDMTSTFPLASTSLPS